MNGGANINDSSIEPTPRAPHLAMTRRKVLILSVAVTGLVLAVSYALGGIAAGEGFAIGMAVVAANMVFLNLAIGLLATTASENFTQRMGSFFIVLMFLMKLPLFVFASIFVHRLPNPAPAWFLVAVGLVYSSTICWALCEA